MLLKLSVCCGFGSQYLQ